MSLVTQVSTLATRIGTEFKTAYAKIGDITTLTTTTKVSTVAAINELKTGLVVIDDTGPFTTKVYSSSKTDSQVAAAVAGLVNAAPSALDTLGEIATQLGSDESAATALALQVSNRLRLDAAGSYTGTQQQQGRDNLSVYSEAQIGDPTTDFVAVFNASLT